MRCSSRSAYGNGKVVRSIAIKRTRKVLRYRKRVRLRPTVDTWYVVQVFGKRPLPTIARPKVPPFAFTNPIWIDADADDTFKPPWSARFWR